MEEIGPYAFYGCSKMTDIKIGSGVHTIQDQAWGNCKELRDVYCLAEQLPSTKIDAFQDSYIEYVTLHVPAASIEAYRAAEPWKNFKSIVAIDGETQEEESCATPTISYKDGDISFACETENVDFVSSIKDSDIKDYNTANIQLTATYEISVYATKAGMKNSETATATLCWIDQDPKKEGMDDNANEVRQPTVHAVLIKSENGTLTIENAEEGEPVAAYTTDGRQLGAATVRQGRTTIPTHLQSGSIAVVKVGKKSAKVIVN